MLLIERVSDDLYVNPVAVDYLEVHRQSTNSWQVLVVFRGGNVLRRRVEGPTEESARNLARRWQHLLNAGETP